jgi:hypothetical protein
MKKIKLRYLSERKLLIPLLKSRGGAMRLPLMDYNKMKPLPTEKQVVEVTEYEAGDLQRCWPGLFEVVKPKPKKEVTENDS